MNKPIDPGAKALEDSWKIQQDAAGLGFDWPDISGVLDKTEEELGEIRAALADGDRDHARRELGDLLLAAVNLGRFLDIRPARALAEANQRFSRRFAALQKELRREGRDIQSCSLDELEAIWQRVKVRADQGLEERA